MPRKETNTGHISAQAQQDLVSEGIENFELPRSLVTKIAKSAIPENTKLQKETVLSLVKGSTVFINYLAATAHDVALSKQHKSISASDVLKALEMIEFGDLVDKLQGELQIYREQAKTDKSKKGTSNITSASTGHIKIRPGPGQSSSVSPGKAKGKEKEKPVALPPPFTSTPLPQPSLPQQPLPQPPQAGGSISAGAKAPMEVGWEDEPRENDGIETEDEFPTGGIAGEGEEGEGEEDGEGPGEDDDDVADEEDEEGEGEILADQMEVEDEVLRDGTGPDDPSDHMVYDDD